WKDRRRPRRVPGSIRWCESYAENARAFVCSGRSAAFDCTRRFAADTAGRLRYKYVDDGHRPPSAVRRTERRPISICRKDLFWVRQTFRILASVEHSSHQSTLGEPNSMAAKKVILDVDPGIDDAIALCLALFDPQFEVVAVTSAGGAVPADQATRNVQAIIEQLDPPRWPRIGAGADPDAGLPAHST